MSDSENQGAKWRLVTENYAPHFKAPSGLLVSIEATPIHLNALEATITTLKAQLEAAEGKVEALWQVYNAAWHLADNTEEDHPDGPSSLLEDFVELDKQMRILEAAIRAQQARIFGAMLRREPTR